MLGEIPQMDLGNGNAINIYMRFVLSMYPTSCSEVVRDLYRTLRYEAMEDLEAVFEILEEGCVPRVFRKLHPALWRCLIISQLEVRMNGLS